MNCWDFGDPNDKSTAMYLVFEDGNTNQYTGLTVNAQRPFTRHLSDSTNSAGSNNMQIFTWTDVFQFNAMIGMTGPLTIRLFYSADNAYGCHFNWQVGLTRTNTI